MCIAAMYAMLGLPRIFCASRTEEQRQAVMDLLSTPLLLPLNLECICAYHLVVGRVYIFETAYCALKLLMRMRMEPTLVDLLTLAYTVFHSLCHPIVSRTQAICNPSLSP